MFWCLGAGNSGSLSCTKNNLMETKEKRYIYSFSLSNEYSNYGPESALQIPGIQWVFSTWCFSEHLGP